MFRARLLRATLVGLLAGVGTGVLAFAWAIAFSANPDRLGRAPSGPWAIAAHAVLYWEAPFSLLVSALDRPCQRSPCESELSDVVLIPIILIGTICSWTVLIGGAHLAWNSSQGRSWFRLGILATFSAAIATLLSSRVTIGDEFGAAAWTATFAWTAISALGVLHLFRTMRRATQAEHAVRTTIGVARD
jgi:hypothetical protein